MSENQNTNREQSMERYFFQSSAASFMKIPESPLTYWLSDKTLSLFETLDPLKNVTDLFKGLSTGENALFIRQ